MQFTIQQSHEGVTRTIRVQVIADAGKKLQRVVTRYDGVPEDDDSMSQPVSHYETEVKKNQGVSPGRKHTVIVEGWHDDGSTDAGQKSWVD